MGDLSSDKIMLSCTDTGNRTVLDSTAPVLLVFCLHALNIPEKNIKATMKYPGLKNIFFD